jgi:hypothetical protein
MKISKRDNKALKKRLVAIFEGILEDAESQFGESVQDELQAYLEEDDEFMDIFEVYFWDAVAIAYNKKIEDLAKTMP